VTSVIRSLWKPFWYELDQTIVVGDRDVFFFESEPALAVAQQEGASDAALVFANGGASENDWGAMATIRSIGHGIFGPLRAVLTEGLDYTVVPDGRAPFAIEAEETPGLVYHLNHVLDDQRFLVVVQDIVSLEKSSSQLLRESTVRERRRAHERRRARWKTLLSDVAL
jgi:hypothetical protein